MYRLSCHATDQSIESVIRPPVRHRVKTSGISPRRERTPVELATTWTRSTFNDEHKVTGRKVSEDFDYRFVIYFPASADPPALLESELCGAQGYGIVELSWRNDKRIQVNPGAFFRARAAMPCQPEPNRLAAPSSTFAAARAEKPGPSRSDGRPSARAIARRASRCRPRTDRAPLPLPGSLVTCAARPIHRI